MQSISVNGTELAYIEAGAGPETVVFSHSYLVDHRQFEKQVADLSQSYRVLAFDHRDHGRSKPASGPYDLDTLCADAVAFIDATDAAPCHFVGLSTGGFVGLRLALRRPDLLRKLVLMDTSADHEGWAKRVKYEGMFLVAGSVGFDVLLPSVMRLMFGPDFRGATERRAECRLWEHRMLAQDPKALVRFGRAIFGRQSITGQLAKIDVPALVMVGEHDVATPIGQAEAIAQRIPGAQLQVIPGAGHLSTIEQPDFVTQALRACLGGSERVYSVAASGLAREVAQPWHTPSRFSGDHQRSRYR